MNQLSWQEEIEEIQQEIFHIRDKEHFQRLALRIFQYQFEQNAVYRKYCQLIGVAPSSVFHIREIPFLPIEFFKTHKVVSGHAEYKQYFQSSGTTGMERSTHYLKDVSLYHRSFLETFRKFYGSPEDYYILALLPGYLENKHSSLIHMVHELVHLSGHPESGFYLDNLQELSQNLHVLNQQKKKGMLLGVSFALLELAEKHPMPLEHTVIMETGGMKGRRKEMTREELHEVLKRAFRVNQIHSEYGMAELLSQAYSTGNGLFQTPPWMNILIREYNDPYHMLEQRSAKPVSGGINVIDLANMHSCAFIETKDIGRKHPDGRFEVLGRFDYTDVRGCNLLVMD